MIIPVLLAVDAILVVALIVVLIRDFLAIRRERERDEEEEKALGEEE